MFFITVIILQKNRELTLSSLFALGSNHCHSIQLVDDVCRECIGTLLQASRAGDATHLVCPLCRATVQGQELVKGVNEGARTLEEEDSLTARLEQQAGSSESKLNALLEEVRLHLHACCRTGTRLEQGT